MGRRIGHVLDPGLRHICEELGAVDISDAALYPSVCFIAEQKYIYRRIALNSNIKL